MGKKRHVKSEKTTFAGITLKETNTTYEQDTFWGIPYGEERVVNEETDYLKLDDSTKEAIADGLEIVSKIPLKGLPKLPFKK